MIKELIDNVQAQLDTYKTDFKDLFELLSASQRSDKAIFEAFDKLFKQYPAHPVLLVLFTDCLQICRDETLLAEYELQDVKNLLEKACDTYKDDVELNMEHYHFIRDIEDDEEEAEAYLDNFRERIDTLLTEDEGGQTGDSDLNFQ